MAPEDVVVDTIKRFKGLERPVVILIVGDGEIDSRELAYVAFTRARSYLCVVGSEEDLYWLKHGLDA